MTSRERKFAKKVLKQNTTFIQLLTCLCARSEDSQLRYLLDHSWGPLGVLGVQVQLEVPLVQGVFQMPSVPSGVLELMSKETS